MNNTPLSLPKKKGYDRAYEQAYHMAAEELVATEDVPAQCLRSGAEYHKSNSREAIIIKYLNQSYLITFPHVEVTAVDNSDAVPIKDKLLILHYINTARGTPPADAITFRDLPEGAVYFPTFSRRTIIPLVNHFGKSPELLLRAGTTLGGYQVDQGDVGIKIIAFPRVPVTVIIWKGDEELPATGNILFNANIVDYLPIEDIIVLSETITWKLIRSTGGE